MKKILYIAAFFSFFFTSIHHAWAQEMSQPPGGPHDYGAPIVIVEGQTVATATGAQTQVFATILDRTPGDPEHATDPQTGRNFNWDSTTNHWINSQTGQVAGSGLWWYLSKTQPSATVSPPTNAAERMQQPPTSPATQPPGGSQDHGAPIVIVEGQTVATATGAQIQVFATILDRTPADPEHATDPQTGRNFNWDSTTNHWINSQTGQVAGSGLWWYLSKTQPSALTVPAPHTPPSLQTPPANNPHPTTSTASTASNKSVSMSGFTPTIQLRGFGGASFINGHTPGTAGFDGAVLFPIGNRVLIGPTAGFQWVNSSIVNLLNAGGGTFSTSANTLANTLAGNVGVSLGMGPVVFDFNAWRFGIRAGATITSSTIKQVQSSTNPTSGTTFTSSTTKHNTTVAPFLGGYISHSIFSHVGVFVGYDYHFKVTELKGSSNAFDLHYSDAVGGFNFTFGHRSK